MKTRPVVCARIARDPDGTPWAPDYDDVYHTRAGAAAQARHVFLGGNGLPARWRGRERFTLLETGFGLGQNFLETWAAWREAGRPTGRLHYLGIDKHPPRREDLRELLGAHAHPELASALIQRWPPATPNLHTLELDEGRVRLVLAWCDVSAALPQIQAEVDAFYLDGFAPERNPDMWSADVFKRIGRLAAPGATAATWSCARAVRDGLVSAGFRVERAAGFGRKREMTVAQFAPRHVPERPAGALRTPVGAREALVLGAGLAGCSAARALGREGWSVRVVEAASAPARGASGNAGGLFHSVFTPDDGPHARWFRTAAQAMARWAGPQVDAGVLPGQVGGLLRLDPRDASGALALLAASGMPAEELAWWTREQATEAIGWPLSQGGWFHGAGGWLSPAAVCARMLAEVPQLQLETGARVQTLRHEGPGRWVVTAEDGRRWEAPHLVVATGSASAGLDLVASTLATALTPVRGQTTVLEDGSPEGGAAGPPRWPVAGQGYALRLDAEHLLCGATTQHGDEDAQIREADHRHNLERLGRLSGLSWSLDAVRGGRTGWRATTQDRLPLIGPLPDADPTRLAPLPRLRQRARRWSDHDGLHLLTGLGSRGLTSAWLAGELLASWVTGSPCPVEGDLRDALDPARLLERTGRGRSG